MKKALLFLTLFLVICISVFSIPREEESWLSLGFSFGNSFESEEKIKDIYMGFPGIDIDIYSFSHKKNIGLFTNLGYASRVINEDVNESITRYSFLIGPGFRHNFNERFNLHFGAGFNVEILYFDREGKNLVSDRVTMGIGGNIGIKYDLGDIVYLNIGTKLFFNFINNRITETTTDNWKTTVIGSDEWVKNYTMFEIRPYIAIGLNFYSYGENRLGKP